MGGGMKRAFTLAAALLALSAAALDEAVERRLGDDAFRSGDYQNSINFYANALRLSAGDQDAWQVNALKLATARLRSGDTAAARRDLEEFRERFPASTAGTLPGEILLAEHRFREAERFFATLAAGEGKEAGQAKFLEALAKLRQGRSLEASFDFEALEKGAPESEWGRRARLARIYSLISAGRLDEAGKLLAVLRALPREVEGVDRLELFADLAREDYTAFLANWPLVRKKYPSGPDPVFYVIAVRGSALAERRGDNANALQLADAAFACAPDDLSRRAAALGLINLQAKSSPREAAEFCRRSLELFPSPGDRAQLLIRGGRLFLEAGEREQAIELFTLVTSNYDLPNAQRLEAAREAAFTARRSGDDGTALRMLEYLLSNAGNALQRSEASYLLGEFYFHKEKYAKAAELLRQATVGGSVEAARFLLLQSQIQLGDGKAAMATAEQLRASANADYRAAGDYYRGILLRSGGKAAEAREAFRTFVKEYPSSTYASGALYRGAELAMEQGNYAEAVTEFSEFAERYPALDSAPAALFLAMQSAWFGGDMAAALRQVGELDRRYPDSQAALEARLQIADFLRGNGKYEQALLLLAPVDKEGVPRSFDILAEALYVRGRIYLAREEAAKALALFNEILEKYPSSAVAADAGFLAGNIEADFGNFENAVKLFNRARELRPTGLFGELCAGRIADCRFNLYAEKLDRGELTAAITAYRKLSEESKDSRIALQSCYKLGRCLELVDEADEALAAYERVLYLAADQRRGGGAPDPSWCGKAAYAAVRLYLKSNTLQAAVRALAVLDRYQSLGLPPTGEDFDRMQREIRNKYNLDGPAYRRAASHSDGRV